VSRQLITLQEIVAAQKRGEPLGITSVCSAHPWVIEAALLNAQSTGEPLLIESTCNQVNQFGGYTGRTPAQFAAYLAEIAAKMGFPLEHVTVGGDHLGPSPWQGEPAAEAMAKARRLVHDCVAAGYGKIHLDASMKCADDDPKRPLALDIAAARTADLAAAAEAAYAATNGLWQPPRYVIGTEVPVPGGFQEREGALAVTNTADLAQTIEATRHAFLQRGLDAAWERVLAVVVQPGVEYGDETLFAYKREKAAELSAAIGRYDRLIYEAHSTDYQTAAALKQMVEDHFAILKVGPALTFAFREGVFALAAVEEELLGQDAGVELSRVRQALDEAMLANPVYWQNYYPAGFKLAREFSYSDRSRYYWPVAQVQEALSRLLDNLSSRPIPLTLLSQYLPVQYQAIRGGRLASTPQAILHHKVRGVLAGYAYACGYREREE